MKLRPYRRLALLRLRHYAELSSRAVLRQWQGLLLLGLLVVGQATTILTIPAIALARLATDGPPLGYLLLALLGALWVLPQRPAILGGAMAPYLRSLPIGPVTRVALDATVLMLADAILLLEMGIAAALGGPGALPGLLLMLALVLGAQLLALRLPLPDARRLARRLPLPRAIKPNLQALAEQPAATATRLAVALGLAAAAAGVATALHFDARALPVAIGALAVVGLVLAHFYRVLATAHAPVRAYFNTLPTGPHVLLLRDLATVMLAGAPPFLMLAAWFGVFDPGSLVAFFLLAVAYSGLLALLRLPILRGGGLGAILAAIVAAGWAGSAIAMVIR